MPLVSFEIGKDTLEGVGLNSGSITCTPTRRRVGGTIVIARNSIREIFIGTEKTIELPSTPLGVAMKIVINSNHAEPIEGYYKIPNVESISFTKLVEIDPETLEVGEPEPEWWAVANATVNSGKVVGDRLILARNDGVDIDAGNVRGLPGKDGKDGKDGARGLPGRDGYNGVDGQDGADGADGLNDAGISALIHTPTSETANALSTAIGDSILSNLFPVAEWAHWGDSLTEGGWPALMATYTGRTHYNGGVGGESVGQIRTRMIAAPEHRAKHLTLWAGRNGFLTEGSVYIGDRIQVMIDYASPFIKHILVLEIPPWETETIGTANRNTLNTVNEALRTRFGQYWLDIATWLRTDEAFDAAGLAKSPLDETDIANGVTPRSLRADAGHLNASGNKAIAWRVAQEAYRRGWIGAIPAVTASAPVVIPELHPAGVTGYSHRWVGSQVPYASGTVLTSWDDSVSGGQSLTVAGAGTATTVDESGVKFVRFSSAKAVAASGESGNVTLTMVVRRTQLTGYVSYLTSHGWQIDRAGDGTIQQGGVGTSSGGRWHSVPGSGLTGWMVIIARPNPAAPRLQVNAATAGAPTAAIEVGTVAPLTIASDGYSTPLDVAEVIVWPTYLTDVQCGDVYAGMKAKYTAIP